MFIWGAIFAIYTTTTLFALVLTYSEQRRSGPQSVISDMVSFLACLVWPLVAVACLFSKGVQESRGDI